MNDLICSAHMTQGASTTFTTDRFGNPNAALNLNGGWTQVPAGVYFNSPQFTVTLWVYPLGVQQWASLFDFGNGQSSDNILLTLDSASSMKPWCEIYQWSNSKGHIQSSNQFVDQQWQFLVYTFDGTQIKLYINGTEVGINPLSYSLPTMTRYNNFFGKSNWASDGFSGSYLDDLKFYSIALTPSQIADAMMSSKNCFKLISFFAFHNFENKNNQKTLNACLIYFK